MREVEQMFFEMGFKVETSANFILMHNLLCEQRWWTFSLEVGDCQITDESREEANFRWMIQ
jgi:hypothetical protein